MFVVRSVELGFGFPPASSQRFHLHSIFCQSLRALLEENATILPSRGSSASLSRLSTPSRPSCLPYRIRHHTQTAGGKCTLCSIKFTVLYPFSSTTQSNVQCLRPATQSCPAPFTPSLPFRMLNQHEPQHCPPPNTKRSGLE